MMGNTVLIVMGESVGNCTLHSQTKDAPQDTKYEILYKN